MTQSTGGPWDVYGPWGTPFPYEFVPVASYSASGTGPCSHCGLYHAFPCPRVRAVEYYPDGTVKRVEYFAPKEAAE